MKQSVNDAVCNIKRLKYKLRSLNFKDILKKISNPRKQWKSMTITNNTAINIYDIFTENTEGLLTVWITMLLSINSL